MTDNIGLNQPTLYTQEVMDANVQQTSLRNVTNRVTQISNAIAFVLRGQVTEGNLEREYANDLYTMMADEAGLPNKTICGTYTVSVGYNGSTVATFRGIEANDEDDACDKVRDELEVDDPFVNITLGYDGNSEPAEISLSWGYDLDLSFDFEAEEE